MTIVESAAIFLAITSTWSEDWVWGLPLIVLTVVIHVLGVGLIRKRIFQAFSRFTDNRHLTSLFAAVLGSTTLLATLLHGLTE